MRPTTLRRPNPFHWETAMLKEFRTFLLRGNVVDLAVGIVIGAAFGALVTALVKDLVTPLISIPGKADFSNLQFSIHGSIFRYGDFLNALIAFLSIAVAIFFFVVKPMNHLTERFQTTPKPDDLSRPCPHCLSSIPREAAVCAHCTRDVSD